jgi:hypothetical protein
MKPNQTKIQMDKNFLKILMAAIAGVLIWFLFILLMTSCKFFQKLEKTKSDTVAVKKVTDTSVKVDTSKTKSESSYLRETFIFPPKDTVINNYYNTTTPAVYIRESGSKTDQTDNFKFEDLRKEVLDSIAASRKNVSSDTKIKVFDFWQILALGLVGLIVIYFITNKISFSLKNKTV